MPYEYADIGGDAGLRATGATFGEALAEAVRGMYALVADPVTVAPRDYRVVRIAACTREEAVVGLLNELIYLIDTEGFLGREAQVTDRGEKGVNAVVRGERIDREKHELGAAPKAATYHALRIEESGGRAVIEVVFDT